MFGKSENTDKDRIFLGGAFLNARWLREHNAYSSGYMASRLKDYVNPVLAITGTKDISVDYRLLDNLSELPNITCYSPSGVNHILRETDGGGVLDYKKEYLRLSKNPMHAETLKTINDWLIRFI